MKVLSIVVAMVLLGLATSAHAQPVACADATTPCKSGQSYGVSITSSPAVQLLAFDGNRKSLIVANQPGSASSVCVALGFVAALSSGTCNGFVLAAGGRGLLLANYSQSNSVGSITGATVSVLGMTGNASVTYYYTD
jgi:hypothetical protein